MLRDSFGRDSGVPFTAAGRDVEAAALLARIRAGDRNAAAQFVLRFGPVLRQRFRNRLGDGLRRLMDSADLVSSVARRLDAAVADHRAWFESEAELWAFLHKLATAVIADKARVLARLRRAEAEEQRWARPMLSELQSSDDRSSDPFDRTVDRALRSLQNDGERRVLSLWLMGMSHGQIAVETDSSAGTVRQQWHRIRGRLAQEFARDGDEHTSQRGGLHEA